MSASISVRDARPSDAATLALLLGQLGYPVAAPELERRLLRMLDHNDQRVLIAEATGSTDRQPIGLLALHIFPVLAYSDDLAMIMALVIDEGARGVGVGRALVDRAAALAREHGASRLMVTTHVRRADAHAFYERLGFEFTGRRYVKALGGS